MMIHKMNHMPYASGMQQVKPMEAANIVLEARTCMGESQRTFAARLGTAQSLVCKYERGDVSPPAAILIQCMNLLQMRPGSVSPDELVALVKTRLSGDQMAAARQAVAKLIQCLPGR